MVTYFYTVMDKQKQKEQEEKLLQASKNAPEQVQKIIKEKLKGVSKPFNK